MSSSRLKKAEDILFRLLDLPAPQRATALDAACAGDESLKAEVASLLAQADSMGGFLDAPALGTAISDLGIDPSASATGDEDLAGQNIGPYRLDRRIASGGMGTVYSASRVDGQYTQQVAIKLVKRGMDSDEIVRRFKVERQALAALSHPNIATLLDGGVTPAGRPYLVMEYVDGLAIDEYCDAQRLPIRDRIRLFRTVCEAVRYAHQHMVVHRDLKPKNILVTADGTPKLLDFGIAKVLSRGETALFGRTTRREEQRLTPEYASPEQLEGMRVTTITDVYSLGVILYELLCGRRPYDVPTGTSDMIARFLQDQTPPPPSSAVIKDDQPPAIHSPEPATGLSLAGTREGTPERLRRKLRGDLDTIALAAMHKDVARRYVSVEALIADIDRYLTGLPILARKDTLAYRTTKFVRRHAWGVATAVAILLLIAGGVVGIARQRDAAIRARNEAYEARDQSEAVSEFLKRTLEGADPAIGGRPDMQIRDILTTAERLAHAEFHKRPAILATVLSSLGRSQLALAQYDKAKQLMEEAMDLRVRHMGKDHHDVAESKMDLAQLYFETNKLDLAETNAREAYEAHRQLRGDENLDTARALNNLASIQRRQGKLDEAQANQQQALGVRQRLAMRASGAGDDQQADLDVAESLNNLANILRTRALKLKEDDPAREDLMTQVEDLASRALKHRLELLTPDHPSVLQSQINLALFYIQRNKLREAETLLDEALPQARRVYSQHPELARWLRNKGLLLDKQSKWKQAEDCFREALSIQLATQKANNLDASDPLILQVRYLLGKVLKEQQKPADAREQFLAITQLASAEFKKVDTYKQTLESLEWADRQLGNADAAARWKQELEELARGK